MKNQQLCQTLLNQWRSDYQRLSDILADEQLALEKRDFECLAKITLEKNRQVDVINRQQIPAELNAEGGRKIKLAELQLLCLATPQLAGHWQDLMALVSRCNFQNEVNARMVDLLHTSCRRTLNLIRGFDPDHNLYNANGACTRLSHHGASVMA